MLEKQVPTLMEELYALREKFFYFINSENSLQNLMYSMSQFMTNLHFKHRDCFISADQHFKKDFV